MILKTLLGLSVLAAMLTLSGGCKNQSPAADGQAAYDALPTVVTQDEFQRQVLDSAKPVLVDFSTAWCGYCKVLAPTLGLLAREFQGKVAFIRVDGDKSADLVRQYGIEGYPTVLIFRPHVKPVVLVGVHEAQEYRQALDNKTKGTDMTTTATAERTVTMHGQPMELAGAQLKVGDKAPDFVVVDNDFKEVHFHDMPGKVFVLSSVPSLDTPVCDRETHRFNEEAGKFGPDVSVLTISMDLPFAQKRWCAAGNVKNVRTLSDYRYASFGSNYGLLLKGPRLEARCVMALDSNRKIAYIQLVPEIAEEPNYDQVLDAVRKLTANF